jgi:hypothetical protein
MPAVRYEHTGNAVATTLATSITAATASIGIVASTGWPSGSVGPFWVTIDRGTASEEKILVLSRTGTTLTVSTRGADGTTATSHASGASIEHTISATEVDDANRIAVEVDALGTVVGTTETQTLTGKTISADSNTLSGIAASSFVVSNGSGNIDGSAAQKVIPSGVVVGTTDTQTLTNKTLTNPLGVPWGVLGYTQVTTTQTGIASGDLTGLTVTVTVGSSRRIRVTGYVVGKPTVSGSNYFEAKIQESTTVLQVAPAQLATINQPGTAIPIAILTPSSGSHTYKLTAAIAVGGGNLDTVTDSTKPLFIMVEDIGAA